MRKLTFKKTVYIIGFTLLIIASSLSAYAKPRMTVRYKNYKISGRTIKQVKQSIRKNGIKAQNGTSYAANADYNISWQFKFNKSDAGCSIASVFTNIAIIYQMPNLISDQSLTGIEKRQWNEYYRALKLHEDGHVSRGIQAAEEIELAIKNMRPQTNCSELTNSANLIGKKILTKYHNDNLYYDKITSHGHAQGALLLVNGRNGRI